MSGRRRRALQGAQFAQAQCHTIRLKLLNIKAQIRMSIRRVYVSLASGYSYQGAFCQIVESLQRSCPQRC